VLAVLYDIHGNLPALEAVLADARAQGADRLALGGDYALMGPWPDEVLALLAGREAAVRIRGNADRWLADDHDAPDNELMRGALGYCRERIGGERVDELARLPERARLPEGLFCHASQRSDMRSFAPEPGEDEAELLSGVTESRLVFGHTHLQFTRRAGTIELLNPGSVGLPFDGDPRAAYALVDDAGEVELRRVVYDHEAVAAAARERMGPWAELLARRLETARSDP
jgi:predicted phosphodiesterase